MAIKVVLYEDPNAARDAALRFLAGDPLLNNLVLTLLAARIVDALPGRYWVAFEDGQVAGMGLQSPLDRAIILTVMAPDVALAMANAIGEEGRNLPGVLGEAQIAARFAGEWTERRKTGAHPVAGQRIYEARAVYDGQEAPGTTERAGTAHQTLVCSWITAFQTEIGEPADAVSELVERRISAGEIWLWNDDGVRSMAAVTASALATSRVQYVYTPPKHRRNGYAEALVRSLTRHMLSEGLRAMLFSDLANPTPNGVYRRIGYEAVAEIIRYRFVMANP
jgi:predicted GNAT family acetyltransferase